MKKSYLIAGALVVAIVLGGAYYFGSGDQLQGSIHNMGTIENAEMTANGTSGNGSSEADDNVKPPFIKDLKSRMDIFGDGSDESSSGSSGESTSSDFATESTESNTTILLEVSSHNTLSSSNREEIYLSSIDFDAENDESDPVDAWDESWKTVGIWDLEYFEGAVSCDRSNTLGFSMDEKTPNAFAQNARVLVLDYKGQRLYPESADDEGYIYPTSSFSSSLTNFDVEGLYDMPGDVTIHLQIQPKENINSGYLDMEVTTYLNAYCVDTFGDLYKWTTTDFYSQNDYFEMNLDETEFGTPGGIFIIHE